jgi:hypothetical protein
MGVRIRSFALLVAASLGQAAHAAPACPPTPHTRDSLEALKAAGFQVEDPARRATLALDLLACLESPNPVLRDGVAFEAWSTWLRAGQLDPPTRTQALDRLLPMIAPGADPGAGFRAPFAALVLSEVARTDRIAPWLEPPARQRLLDAGAAYLGSVRDYRGFDEREGWRHGVAHGADLMLQLVLNPALDKPQIDQALAAVAAQVAPAGHAYIHGEPERLARPVLYAALRGLHTEAEWKAWFDGLVTPAPAATWREAMGTQAGLARRHDLRAFLLAVYVEQVSSDKPGLLAMRPALETALKQLP